MKELEQGSSSRNRKKSTPKRSNVPQTNLKLVKSKSSSDSSNSAQAHQGSSQTVPNQVVKVKEKADSTLNTLNTEVKVSSDNREQELVRSQVNNHRTLLEKLQDPSYTPNFDDDEYDDDFHNY